MKQDISIKNLKEKKCNKASCFACAECNTINFEERRQELKATSSQLYASEAESYFFYYAMRIKQAQ